MQVEELLVDLDSHGLLEVLLVVGEQVAHLLTVFVLLVTGLLFELEVLVDELAVSKISGDKYWLESCSLICRVEISFSLMAFSSRFFFTLNRLVL